MNQQKGFTLTEVLVSLMLVSTVALALIELQFKTSGLLKHLILSRQTVQLKENAYERAAALISTF